MSGLLARSWSPLSFQESARVRRWLSIGASRFKPARLLAVALLFAVFALGCEPEKQPQVTPTPESAAALPTAALTPAPPSPTPAPTATPRPPPESRPFPPELRRQVQALLDRTAQIRGTPPKSDVEMNLINRKVAVEYFRNGYDEEDLAEIAVSQDLYRLLSLIPPDADIKELFLSLLGIGILGFYDPELKAFFLLDDLGGIDSSSSRTTIVHEFSHALQDQYYDINAIQKRLRHDHDAMLAFIDVLEGDAVATEGAYSGTRPRGAACFAIPPVINLGRIPFVIQRELNTWYEDGYCFVRAVSDKLPNGTASLFEKLPTTSEQILHPEKYLSGEGAKAVVLPNLESVLGEGWKEIGRDKFGEFSLQNVLVLGFTNDRKRAQDAAAGWGGDEWTFYARGDQRLFNMRIDWDTTDDAREFFASLRASLERRVASTATAVTDTAFRIVLEGKTWRASISGDQTTLLVTNDPATLDRLGLP